MTPTHSSLVLYQHFVFGFHGYEVSSDIEALIRDYYLGYAQIVRRREPSLPTFDYGDSGASSSSSATSKVDPLFLHYMKRH
jgi:hypothetical protein